MAASTLTAPSTAAVSRPSEAPGQARRLRPPSWRDPRLVVGLVLVLGSTLGGGLLVRGLDDSVPVYAARRTLVAGRALTSADVTVAQVRISGGTQRYLPASRRPDGALVVLRSVRAGELVPVSALADAGSIDLRPVAVPSEAQAVARLGPGVLVDVWVANPSSSRADGFERPRQVAAAVQVSARATAQSTWGATASSSVQLLLTPDLVPVVIEAVNNQARITLVPVPASLRGSGEEGW